MLLADPPAFTPAYDHELAAALARAGAEVQLATSRFRFGSPPDPDGYRRSERYYPLSSRLFGRSRLRLPLRAVEHLHVVASLARARRDVLHLQWLALPEVDARVRFRSPAVFTAHDLLPRRTAGTPAPSACRSAPDWSSSARYGKSATVASERARSSSRCGR